MNKLILLLLLTSPLISAAQKKQFTFNQLFAGNYPAVFKPLPQVEGWADDQHYLERRGRGAGEQLMSVDAVTGKATPYQVKNPEEAPPVIKDAMNITLSPDGKWAAYTKENNLYSLELSTNKETALTSDGSDSVMNGYASWLYYEEILGRASHYKAFWWSPDSKYIAFMHFDDSKVPVFPIYVAEGQHGYLEKQRYSQPGDKNPEVKIGITPVASSATVWADFNAQDDQYFGTPQWTPANELWVQWMNRNQDTLLVYAVDKLSGSRKQVYLEHQPTWVTLDDADRITFLKGNGGCLIKSDKDGWDNLYLYDLDGKFINRVTTGNFRGTSVLLIDEKNKQVFLQARKDNSTRNDIYRVSLDGKTTVRLSSGKYSYDLVQVSPSGKYMVALYSGLSTVPTEVLLNEKGQQVRELGNYRGPEFDQYALPVTVITTVKSADKLFDLPMSITYPIHFDSTKKYPVWISVYGGPGYSTVYDRWNAGRGINQWWAQEGIIQVTMDNRSSGHFGKKGMDYIYKQLGKWEIEDYMDCARWLRSQPWVDASKIGITGGSFGGYITCMALTYGAGVFTHGIANYSVTDWKLYDSHYTERFMNTPKQNPEGYAKTSVMAYTSKYKGVLRIVHGSSDDNVHLQNSMQLIDKLETLNKSFELMIYPGQRHGIGGDKSAFDFTETSRFVYRYMLGRDLPVQFGD